MNYKYEEICIYIGGGGKAAYQSRRYLDLRTDPSAHGSDEEYEDDIRGVIRWVRIPWCEPPPIVDLTGGDDELIPDTIINE